MIHANAEKSITLRILCLKIKKNWTKNIQRQSIIFKYNIQEKEKCIFMLASRGEIKIHEILTKAGLNFIEEYSIPGLNSSNGRPLRFDFVVFDDDGEIDFIIEYQGRQHYEATSKFGGKKGLY